MSFTRKFIYVLTIMSIFSSCVSHQELINFNSGEEFEGLEEKIDNIPTLKIQTDDLLSIRVLALEEEAALPFNIDPPTLNMANLGSGSARPIIGYLVNQAGTIDFPVLGVIKVIGLTTAELQDTLGSLLAPYLQEPVIVARFLNFRVTVLGEVTRPGTFFMSNERVTILDALGQAGDLTPYGNRTNMLVIREKNGEREFGHLNLQDRSVFRSPFFYLQQNDVLYIEPLEERTGTLRDQSQRILPWLSIITALTTLVLTLRTI
ncbi:MAG: polysaccharide biosynthesis/export family protein [Lewinella sp.]|uniref:polysaccharide biosynthesis/export family protein n=1 Tax=Lewinella sp. TaxID=2004506 RepID=UPI003D6B1099